MEISTNINVKSNFREHALTGVIEIEKLTSFLKKFYNSSDFNPNMNVLWDLREADFSSVSSEGIQLFKQYVGKIWGIGGESKAALVVSKDLDYGMTRMYQILMEDINTSKILVIRNMDEAKKWLGII